VTLIRVSEFCWGKREIFQTILGKQIQKSLETLFKKVPIRQKQQKPLITISHYLREAMHDYLQMCRYAAKIIP
jgi:hypothetical protein